MKLRYYGHSCFSLQFDGCTVVTDPFDGSVGYPLCTAAADIALTSHDHFDHNAVQFLSGSPRRIQEPGRYSLGGLDITGVASWHDPDQGAKRGPNTIFRIEGDGLRIVHLGDLGHALSAKQIAEIGPVDILMIPVGGYFTIDTPQAIEIVRQIRPRTAIAMHFKTPELDFPISDASGFASALNAREMPCEIDITPETLSQLPAAVIMARE